MDFRTKYNQIPRKNIAGMRDIVVHKYETIDKCILWNVADEEIDKIKEFCQDILNEGYNVWTRKNERKNKTSC